MSRLFHYIEAFHNGGRRYSALSYLSPADFDREPPQRETGAA
jgi:hypothetical protein